MTVIYKVITTDPRFHAGATMLLHQSTKLGYGAVVKDHRGYVVVWSTYGANGKDGQFAVHTLAWAKRMLRKHIGGSW